MHLVVSACAVLNHNFIIINTSLFTPSSIQADSIMPPNKSKLTLLCDRSDYGSNSSDIEFVKASSKVMQDNFPERLHKCIIYPSGLVCTIFSFFFIRIFVFNISKTGILGPLERSQVVLRSSDSG